jgi:hypothetical protein
MSVDPDGGGDTLRPSTPVLLFSKLRRLPDRLNSLFSMDGRAERFLLVQDPERATGATELPITVVLNFVPAVARK